MPRKNKRQTALNSEIGSTVYKLTQGQGRPFLCNGNPTDCKIALVGINPGTPVSFWDCWSVENGCDKETWLANYLDLHGRLKPTRDRIETFCTALGKERCLELNLTHHFTPTESDLSREQLSDNEVFSYMVQTVQPKVLVVHGLSPTKHLEKLLSVEIPKEKFIKANYLGTRLKVYRAKSHFSRGVSREYVRHLAKKIQNNLHRS